MSYIDGFVIAVPTASKQKFIDHATLGNGVFIAEDEAWQRQRKLVAPAFHAMRIRAYAATMADYTREMVGRWQDGQVVALDKELTQLTLRNPRTERRSCDIWAVQFELVMAAHRAPWNRFPNPMFELDQITTACVAVAMSLPDGDALVLGQGGDGFVRQLFDQRKRGGDGVGRGVGHRSRLFAIPARRKRRSIPP